MAMFSAVLVANRGEISCRITRTLHSMGIRSIAVYTEHDRDAKHVRVADAAVLIDSYLSVESIVAAAHAVSGMNADGIHPGYGFLSENASLAEACAAGGITFIGPGVEALEIMGDKIASKKHVTERGVAVIPGIAEPGMTNDDLVAAAAEVGFPLLIKPSAGGGGKGMTIVREPDAVAGALDSARRVASAAFGDDTLFLERLVEKPRHIEVQVLADSHGTTIHLGERECSLQRRHQKIIEEAPSPLLDEATRQRIGEAACEVARSVNYVGAGTVEFLVSDNAPDEFFFMEMNTRLQVEHPVTEMVTGIDLVEWQVRIAAGEKLTVETPVLTGHSVEARIYSEDPANDFLPSAGQIVALHEANDVRVDSSLVEGGTVSANYDPMLAKVISHAATRDEALTKLDRALADTVILGVTTNIEFLRALLNRDDVRAGDLDTGLIERALAEIEFAAPTPAVLAAAALSIHSERWMPGSPWQRPSGWRVGQHRPARYRLACAGQVHEVLVAGPPSAAEVTIDGTTTPARLTSTGIEWGTQTIRLTIETADATVWIGQEGTSWALTAQSRAESLAAHRATLARVAGVIDPELRSPMPGTVVAVAVAHGDAVTAGQTVLTIEAMKMEHPVVATLDGVVDISLKPGDLVTRDQIVARIESPQASTEGETS
ncbi:MULTISPECIES: biotin carboxylase N-terminal domain-containing protein [unclassified Salinibacterium]|uniref:ATP-binding protein n=2 Tax=unclassified Salinibacterium TaxID=2632331 RepID=UPI0018CDFC44|nr:ATP-grasp domain-containing protein [Salinibacterium sp. SWN139]MBH0083132.1 ATP-grasp domain-containing protein [Salinibacterium sp. SWN167]